MWAKKISIQRLCSITAKGGQIRFKPKVLSYANKASHRTWIFIFYTHIPKIKKLTHRDKWSIEKWMNFGTHTYNMYIDLSYLYIYIYFYIYIYVHKHTIYLHITNYQPLMSGLQQFMATNWRHCLCLSMRPYIHCDWIPSSLI